MSRHNNGRRRDSKPKKATLNGFLIRAGDAGALRTCLNNGWVRHIQTYGRGDGTMWICKILDSDAFREASRALGSTVTMIQLDRTGTRLA